MLPSTARAAAALLTILAPLALAACGSGASSAGRTAAPPGITYSSTGAQINFEDGAARAGAPLQASPAQVFELLPVLYERFAIPVDILDEDGRSLGSRRFTRSMLAGRRTEDYVRCAGAGHSRRRFQLRIVSTVTGAPGGAARVVTEVTGTATSMDGTSTGPVHCASTGELEARMQQVLEEMLAS